MRCTFRRFETLSSGGSCPLADCHDSRVTWTMSKWRYLILVFALLVISCVSSSDGQTEPCGQILNGPNFGDGIYVLCPSLSELSPQQARGIIEVLLNTTPRSQGDTHILFFGDTSVLDRDWQFINQDKRIESWGDTFVGAYRTQSSILTVRSATGSTWQNIYLPLH